MSGFPTPIGCLKQPFLQGASISTTSTARHEPSHRTWTSDQAEHRPKGFSGLLDHAQPYPRKDLWRSHPRTPSLQAKAWVLVFCWKYVGDCRSKALTISRFTSASVMYIHGKLRIAVGILQAYRGWTTSTAKQRNLKITAYKYGYKCTCVFLKLAQALRAVS